MGILFSPAEIFEIAIAIEHNGADFYRKAAAQVDEIDARHELLELAAMEDGHEVTFTELKNDLVGGDEVPDWYDAEDEAVKYLENFAAGQVFDMTQDPTQWLKPGMALKEVIAFALQRERDSVVFFVGIKDLVAASLGAVKVDAIIKQEMGHIALLGSRLANLAAQG